MSLACQPEAQHLNMDGPLPSIPESITSQMESDPARILRMLTAKLESIPFRLVRCESELEFESLRNEEFGKYVRLCVSASSFLKAELDLDQIQRITKDAFAQYCEMFESEPSKIDRNALDEIAFSVSTLRRAYALLERIHRIDPPKQDLAKDRELSAVFMYWALYSQLHLDCLRTSVTRKLSVAEGVLPVILRGLRTSLMAYSYAKQGVRLRECEPQLQLSAENWDEEDKLLAEESTNERESTLSGW